MEIKPEAYFRHCFNVDTKTEAFQKRLKYGDKREAYPKDCLKMEKMPEACPKDCLNMEAKTEA